MRGSTKLQFYLDRATTIAARYWSDVQAMDAGGRKSGVYEITSPLWIQTGAAWTCLTPQRGGRAIPIARGTRVLLLTKYAQ